MTQMLLLYIYGACFIGYSLNCVFNDIIVKYIYNTIQDEYDNDIPFLLTEQEETLLTVAGIFGTIMLLIYKKRLPKHIAKYKKY
jgi:hypothetical protein